MSKRYSSPVKKFVFYDPLSDIVKVNLGTACGSIKEGCLLGKVYASDAIVPYDPSGKPSAATTFSGEHIVVGVLLHEDATGGDLVDIAVRGTFGDIYAFVNMNQNKTGDGSTSHFALSREVLEPETTVVKVAGATKTFGVHYTIEDGTAAGTDAIKFSTATNTSTGTVASIPANSAAITIWYKGKFTQDDFWNSAPDIIVRPVTGYPA